MARKLQSPHYVAYMDVLGFKNYGQSNVEILNKLSSAINAVKRRLDHLVTRRTSQEPQPFLKVFTDNIVLAWPVTTEDGDAELARICYDIVVIQMTLFLHGFFVRGGLVYGKLYIDEDVVYGVPLVEAVSIEENVAKYPRVALADSVLLKAQSLTKHYESLDDTPHVNYITRDKATRGSIKFIDYLKLLVHERDIALTVLPIGEEVIEDEWVDENGEWVTKMSTLNLIVVHNINIDIDPDQPEQTLLRLHRAYLIERLDHLSDPKVRGKYEWLATYHNWVVDEFSIYELSKDERDLFTIPSASYENKTEGV